MNEICTSSDANSLSVFGLDSANPVARALHKVGALLGLKDVAVIVDDSTPETFIRGGSDALAYCHDCKCIVMNLAFASQHKSLLKGVNISGIVNALIEENSKEDWAKIEKQVMKLYKQVFLETPETGV